MSGKEKRCSYGDPRGVVRAYRIPPGWEVHLGRWTVFFYRKPFTGWNGRRIVVRKHGRP